MSDGATLLVIVGAAVLLFVQGRLPVMLVALGVCVSLWFTGLVTLEQAFAGFGDPVIVVIAGLFIVSAGLESAGVTAWVGQRLTGLVRGSPLRLSLLTVTGVAALSPLISMSGATAAFVPVVTLLALRMGEAPSRHLMPLAFASAAGSKLALTGTAKNVLIADASADNGYGGFAFFEFAYVGVPLVLGTIVVVALLGRRLLPERTPANLPGDFGRHAQTLVEQYRLDHAAAPLHVREASPLVGRLREDRTLGAEEGVAVVTATREGAPLRAGPLRAGDVLVLQGPDDRIAAFAARNLLSPGEGERGSVADTLFNRNSGLAEVIVPPRSKLIGTAMSPGMATESGELVVIAIRREGEPLGDPGRSEVVLAEPVEIRAGDQLLLQGSWGALDRRLSNPEVLVVDPPDAVRRQAVPLGRGSTTMLLVVAGMVAALASGVVPASIGVLLAAMAVIGLGILKVERAYRAIDWNTVILVGAMLPLSTAMYGSGTAGRIADALTYGLGDAGPHALLAGLFLLTATLGQVVSNTATTMILIPVAVVSAAQLGVSAQPVLMALNVGASAAFLTPVATTANLIVMGPGGYRFGDYWKLGLVLMALYFAVAILWVPVVWPL